MVNIYCRSDGYCNKVTMFDYDYDREERMFESGYIKVENIDAAKIHIINNLFAKFFILWLFVLLV